MRHHNNVRKFGRDKTGKRALLNSLARNLIIKEKIKTTEPKAKELRPFVEKLVTRAKKGDMATKRLLKARLSSRGGEIKKLFEVLAKRYSDRNGGYTRIFKMGARKSDGAKMAVIEFIK